MPSFGAGKALFFWASEVVVELEFGNRSGRLPRPGFRERQLAALRLLKHRRDAAGGRIANTLVINGFGVVANDRKAARFQLVDVPEITAAAMLIKAQHELVVATAVDPCPTVSTGTPRSRCAMMVSMAYAPGSPARRNSGVTSAGGFQFDRSAGSAETVSPF